MAVRTIGGKKYTGIQLPRNEVGVSGEGVEESGIDSDVTLEERGIDTADNGGEQSNGGFTNPEDIAGAGDSDSGAAPYGYTKSGRRRNRPVGTGRRGKAASSGGSKTTDSVAAMLFTVHTVAASLLKMPVLKIDKESCSELAEAVMQVTELYEIPLLDEKGMAWLNLAGVAVRVYIYNGKGKSVVVPEAAKENSNTPAPMPIFMTGKVN